MSTTVKHRAPWLKRKALLPTLLCLLPPLCSAQQNKLIVHPADPITVKRGESVTRALSVAVLPGFHVNNDKPKDEFLIPLKLTWNSGPLEAKGITYPKAEEIKVGDQMLTVYTGNFDIQTKFVAAQNAPAGPATLTGKLHYQACNNEMCFRPTTADVQVRVLIE